MIKVNMLVKSSFVSERLGIELKRAILLLGAALTTVVVLAAMDGTAHASTKPVRSAKAKKSIQPDALRRKKNLVFDGRTSESLAPSKYDSLSQLSDARGDASRRLYSLPRDFSNRVASQSLEMGYRQ